MDDFMQNDTLLVAGMMAKNGANAHKINAAMQLYIIATERQKALPCPSNVSLLARMRQGLINLLVAEFKQVLLNITSTQPNI